jgi:hypothetical protein
MAQTKESDAKQFKISYEYDPGYRMIAANGLHGGITPRGDLLFDLFAEYTKPPKSVNVSIAPEGKVTEERIGEPLLVRRL